MDQTPPTRTKALAAVIETMARLRAPNGCPWDRAQTFDSIKRHTLEETYEVFDAIDRRAWPELKDELGDLLLQVLFYAQMAEEAGHFAIEDVAESLNGKLIRRHPHVFGDAEAATVDEVNRTWERVKQAERAGRPEAAHWLEAVPRLLPAVLEAEKLGARAAKVGFDWPEIGGLFAKLEEETAELHAEVSAGGRDASRIADELGDLLFTGVQMPRHLGVAPEFALRAANRKFRERFNRMEAIAGGAARVEQASAKELDALWQQAKEDLRAED